MYAESHETILTKENETLASALRVALHRADDSQSRELKLRKSFDQYGLALMMIAEGVENPRALARETLLKVAGTP